MNVQQHPGAWLGVQTQHPKQTTPVIRSEAFKSTSELSKNCEMTHAAHLPRRGQFGRHTTATGQGDPHPHHGRHILSLRADMMGRMNNIIDYVLRTASPKSQMAGIENSMGRINIVPLLNHQDDD